MWRTPDGDGVLAPGEWALVRAGLELTWDAVEVAREAGAGDATGVRVFDARRHVETFRRRIRLRTTPARDRPGGRRR